MERHGSSSRAGGVEWRAEAEQLGGGTLFDFVERVACFSQGVDLSGSALGRLALAQRHPATEHSP